MAKATCSSRMVTPFRSIRMGARNGFQTLTLTGELAQICSVDPKTGNLAVTYFKDVYHADVAVYQKATGTPKLYTHGWMVFSWCGYDDKGNLFVDGLASKSSDDFEFAELPTGGSRLKTITLNQTFGWPGGVQWDGKYVDVADSNTTNIYQFTITGSSGALQGTINLEGPQLVTAYWIHGKKIVATTFNPSSAAYWAYPAGGTVLQSITQDVRYPHGVTISEAPK